MGADRGIAAVVPISAAAPASGSGSWGSGGFVSQLALSLVNLVFPFAGLHIVLRQPRNTIGWVLQGIGVAWGVGLVLAAYDTYGLLVDPGSLPRPDVVAAINEGTWAPWIGLMGTYLLLLFPDGHLPSPRWRPVAWGAAASIIAITLLIPVTPGTMEESPVPAMQNPIGLESAELPLLVALGAVLPLLPLSILASAAGLVVRFRRSRGVERQQLKWLAAAGTVVAVVYLLAMLSSLAASLMAEQPTWVTAVQNLSLLSFVLVPLAIGIAILRYRLYDIDVVINRALVYGSLTATLAGAYLGSVLLLQLALSPLTDQFDLAVAGSTLAVAALFGPARRRIQAAVDRRFYRRRYDAAQTLDAFTGRLRHEVDLKAVGADLRTAVSETMQPTHVSLWLRVR